MTESPSNLANMAWLPYRLTFRNPVSPGNFPVGARINRTLHRLRFLGSGGAATAAGISNLKLQRFQYILERFLRGHTLAGDVNAKRLGNYQSSLR